MARRGDFIGRRGEERREKVVMMKQKDMGRLIGKDRVNCRHLIMGEEEEEEEGEKRKS